MQLAWWFNHTGSALTFDAVLADFPLAYKHSNFRHCNLVQPSSKLAAEALLSETGNKPICIKYFVIVCFLSTHLFIYVYKRAAKNFEIQTNVVLGKNKRTNISKKSKMQFREIELQKKNGKNERANISKNSKMQFGEKMNGQ